MWFVLSGGARWLTEFRNEDLAVDTLAICYALLALGTLVVVFATAVHPARWSATRGHG
jgi:hypothetical protein